MNRDTETAFPFWSVNCTAPQATLPQKLLPVTTTRNAALSPSYVKTYAQRPTTQRPYVYISTDNKRKHNISTTSPKRDINHQRNAKPAPKKFRAENTMNQEPETRGTTEEEQKEHTTETYITDVWRVVRNGYRQGR